MNKLLPNKKFLKELNELIKVDITNIICIFIFCVICAYVFLETLYKKYLKSSKINISMIEYITDIKRNKNMRLAS
tara:strand:- start:57 stop:281 length:225 start_codon:yes stop_codon:yes gene_type:complete